MPQNTDPIRPLAAAPLAPVPPDSSALAQSLLFHACVIEVLGTLMRAPVQGIDAAILRALERIGQFCQIDRAQVFRLSPATEGAHLHPAQVWTEPGIRPAFSPDEPLPPEMAAVWSDQLSREEGIVIPDVAALPDGSSGKARLQAEGVLSLLVVPMRAEGRFSGFITFDCLRRPRSFEPGELTLLLSVADAIGALLTRADTAAEIARSQDSLAEANHRLIATLRALPDLILEVDSEGRYLDIHTSDPGQMIQPPESLIGAKDDEVLPPEIAALNRRAMAEVDEKGLSGPHHFWAETPRGQRRYAMTAARRPPLKPGEAPGYVYVARDVTTEWTLQRESERLSLIARRMNDMVIITDTEHRIEWVNPAFEARTGRRAAEVIGLRAPELLQPPGKDVSEVPQILQSLEAGHSVRAELRTTSRSGKEYWNDVFVQPLQDRSGQVDGYMSIATDITAQKSHAAALERLAQEATEARNRLETAVEALPDAFVYFDADNKLVLCNKRYRALNPPGQPPLCGLNPPQQAEAQEQQLADGRWLRLIERATPDGGRVAMCIDITEVKETGQRMADIIHGAEVGTWEWNIATGVNVVNARWAGMVGYTLDELAPCSIDIWRRLTHSDDLSAAEAQLARVLAGETDQFEYSLRMRHKDGHWVRVISRGRVSRRAPDGTPAMMAGVHIDITALSLAEERLAQIIEAARAGTWQFEYPDGRRQINAYWAEMLGYRYEELAARPNLGFHELLHPEDLAKLEQLHQERLLRGDTHFSQEIRLRHAEGHWVWVLSRGQVVEWDAEGKPLREAGIHLDISDRKALEAQLTAERDYLSRLMETSASGLVALDKDGHFLYANREAERILGRDAEDLGLQRADSPDWQMTELDGRPFAEAREVAARVMRQRETVRDLRFGISLPDGTRRLISVNASPIRAEGLRARVVCSLRDITDQIAAETALRLAADRAEAANEAKSRFLANMSHEIRTPLNGVLGMAQALEDELTDPGHLRSLALIRDSGEMLLGVLNDILDMSKIEAGKLTLETVPFDPGTLAARIDAMHRPNAIAKGLGFDLHLSDPLGGLRLGDPGRLSQVLHNLIGNAVKFTETGGVSVTLGSTSQDLFEVTVKDTGIGMSEAQLSRVFEEFEQADGTVTRRFGGTGLGMAIVRRLVDLMGGSIGITSQPDVGTEVRLCLPLPPAAGVLPSGPALPEPLSLAGLRALVADDNDTNRLILKTMLARLQVDAVLVADGRAAVEAWQPGRFDVILLDISMPVLDGISALSAIRAREQAAGLPPLPAAAITANALSHQIAEYTEAGFAAHLGKPFRREDLAAVLASLAVPV